MIDGIDWSDAAIIAALIGGGFAVGKEVVAFLFRLLENHLAERRRRITLKSRIAHLFAQMGIDSVRTLQAWEAAVEAQRALGLPLGPQAPPIDFLSYDDPTLIADAVILTDELPEVVTALAKVQEVLAKAREAFEAEDGAFGKVTFEYLYPRTRRLLGGLAQLSITYLRSTAENLPENIWDPEKGARAAYIQAAKNLERDFADLEIPTQEEMQVEVLRANKRLSSGGI